MLIGADKIPPYERQMLFVFKQCAESSRELTETQKRIIETKLQEVVDVWTKQDFV